MNVRGSDELRVEAERGRMLVEESREIVVVLDEEQRVIGAMQLRGHSVIVVRQADTQRRDAEHLQSPA